MTRATSVKVCGIRRREDAEMAIELGAGALGFVFWPSSPRAVAAAAVREIASALPRSVEAIGVFVNQPRDEVLRTAEAAGLTGLQLHGDEAAAEYEGCGLRVIKAVSVREPFDPASLAEIPPEVTVLLDAHDPVRRGGTGRTVDWASAAAAARARRIILAGGLTPENVGAAVRIVRPHAVDVSSGVEAAPGVKDGTKLRAFFAALASEPLDGHDS